MNRRRAPRGARGLKWSLPQTPSNLFRSRPSRGAWIEILMCTGAPSLKTSRPSRGAWIEMSFDRRSTSGFASRPSRGAWIEIRPRSLVMLTTLVAPLAGRVD